MIIRQKGTTSREGNDSRSSKQGYIFFTTILVYWYKEIKKLQTMEAYEWSAIS